MKRTITIIPIAALLLLGLAAFTHSLPQTASLVPAAPLATEVGLGSGGKIATENVGRVDQDGPNFTGYGYLNYINGLAPSSIFSDPYIHSQTTAHFTYYATATLTSRSVISGVFALDSAGVLSIYYNLTPQATFTNPASFAAGSLIAHYNLRNQDILSVQAPNLGIATGFGDLEQTIANPFNIDTTSYQLGQVNLLERSFYTGEGTRTNPIIPTSFIVLSGNTVVTGIPAVPLYLPVIKRSSP